VIREREFDSHREEATEFLGRFRAHVTRKAQAPLTGVGEAFDIGRGGQI